MMHDHGQSDSPMVPTKFPNKAGRPAAEGMEGRGLAKGNPGQQTAPRAQDRVGVPSALERVRQVAERDKQVRFTTLLHHVYHVDHLRAAYFALKRDAAPGIDGERWQHYGEALEENLRDLSGRLARGAYRAKPVKRTYIAKADGRQRPLGIRTREDKIVQRTTVEVLNTISETDFLDFSYGFRPGRSPHHALDALYAGLLTRKVNWVLDLDIRGFFDAIDRGWLGKFVEHRIADRRVGRLSRSGSTLACWRTGRGGGVRRARPRAVVFRRCWLTCTCTTPSTLGPSVAEEAGPRRHDGRPVCRRCHRGVSAPGGGRAVPD